MQVFLRARCKAVHFRSCSKLLYGQLTGGDFPLALRLPQPVSMPNPVTVAAGLAPPFAGTHTFAHVQAFVDEVVLVSDASIVAATAMLSRVGLLVEASGAAGLAAIIAGAVGDLQGKKIACVLSGGNITAEVQQGLLYSPICSKETNSSIPGTGGLARNSSTLMIKFCCFR